MDTRVNNSRSDVVHTAVGALVTEAPATIYSSDKMELAHLIPPAWKIEEFLCRIELNVKSSRSGRVQTGRN